MPNESDVPTGQDKEIQVMAVQHLPALPALPAFVHHVARRDCAKPAEVCWSGEAEPPRIGQSIINGQAGAGEVIAYFVEDGWLGLVVSLSSPPKWLQRQRAEAGQDPFGPVYLFGREVRYLDLASASVADRSESHRAEVDRLTRYYTAFKSLEEMVERTHPAYRPSLYHRPEPGQEPCGRTAEVAFLADTYDRAQQARGDARRAYRGN